VHPDVQLGLGRHRAGDERKRSTEEAVISIPATTLAELVRRHGGVCEADGPITALVRTKDAKDGHLAPLFSLKYLQDAQNAKRAGAALLVAKELTNDPRVQKLGGWVHPHAQFAMAQILDGASVPDEKAYVLENTIVGDNTILGPRVRIGRGVRIGVSCVIGGPGFGWTTGPHGVRSIPQKAGVIIEDDVWIGNLVTIDSGTLHPTVIKRGVRLDSQIHVGHNCEIGEGTIIAAQSGLAGSVRIGRGCVIGGQSGIADHVVVGDRARIAAGSGVIGDVPADGVFAGYPAVPRMRWLRGLSVLYRLLEKS
jgi:UDP-3-O-[3-hydroxymyristoyl] glucosamine N-acyltransferase